MKTKILVSMIISVLLALIWFADIHADEIKLTARDGVNNGYFGIAVDISGDYAIMGSPEDESDNGSAYIFKRHGTFWKQQAHLRAKDGGKDDWFGYSVAISDDYAIVAAPWDDDKGEDTGSVYFFKRNGDSWSEEVKFTPHDGPIKRCKFGYSVDISGDYVIVGSPEEDWASGAVYIFHYDGNSWKEQAKFTAKDNAAWDDFGWAVSISGDFAIVGAIGDKDKGDWTGSAYFFKREGTSWIEQAKVTASDAEADAAFGMSVYISGDYAIVGAPWNDVNGMDSGSVYIFYYDGLSWSEQIKVTASDGAADDRFGRSVYISGDYAIVSANRDDNKGLLDSGSIHAFLRNGTSWNQVSKHIPSDGEAGDWFGTSVSIAGDYAIVGAYKDDDKGLDSGSAYIYHARDLSLPFPVEPSGSAVTTFANEKNRAKIINGVVLPAEPAQPIPTEFYLLQNYPNPFNPDTWLPYQLASDAIVTIRIYDVKGQVVRELNLGRREAGNYITKDRAAYWDGKNNAGEPVASGVYFYRLEAGDFYQTRKMTVLK